ncbi:hypothetical protein SJAG_05198 [Schizosaccharomyces japonicus yFS275]|uniref:Uncharacterized protein n=1 Tax=Schizosaccharomyces japonicus (strain yFS275 / FY16936) TaxID=402676 RepID=B6JW77_SCHJY|nr:hypothetical protein SJAG_05198 [Schizosaccharomyces japonicus yFS275]EEB05628.1 hypothetical protein SJAG_05198 [Schizosaccharomyces japonicus yFS275]
MGSNNPFKNEILRENSISSKKTVSLLDIDDEVAALGTRTFRSMSPGAPINNNTVLRRGNSARVRSSQENKPPVAKGNSISRSSSTASARFRHAEKQYLSDNKSGTSATGLSLQLPTKTPPSLPPRNAGLSHSKSNSSRRRKPQVVKPRQRRNTLLGIDKIDRLDVSGLYEGQASIHHDGPFDPCNPHRNKVSSRSPVAAFSAESLTGSLACVMPSSELPRISLDDGEPLGNELERTTTLADGINKTLSHTFSNPDGSITLAQLGAANEAASSRAKAVLPTVHVSPAEEDELVAGVETLGLGTTTRIEGTPASQAAIQRSLNQKGQGGMSPSSSLRRKRSIVAFFRE